MKSMVGDLGEKVKNGWKADRLTNGKMNQVRIPYLSGPLLGIINIILALSCLILLITFRIRGMAGKVI